MQLNGGGGSLFKILKAREVLRAGHVTFCFLEAKCALSGGALSGRPAQVPSLRPLQQPSRMHLVLSSSNLLAPCLLVFRKALFVWLVLL